MPPLASKHHPLRTSSLRTSSVAIVLSILTLWTFSASAQRKEEGGGEGPRHGPPPEALAACKSLVAGKECSFTQGSNTLKGTCWAPEGKPLACRPPHAPAPGGDKPANIAK
jgi:hypothetical protein